MRLSEAEQGAEIVEKEMAAFLGRLEAREAIA